MLTVVPACATATSCTPPNSPQCCPTLLVIVIKMNFGPSNIMAMSSSNLDGMENSSIFRVQPEDPNLSVILETLTGNGQQTIMAQVYLPEISAGDKRILMINGEAVPYALARVP